MRFGLLTYRTSNLGDEVQSVAARRFLPAVDVLLQRDELPAAPDGAGPVHAILNGWYAQRPVLWPPHPRIHPLLLSMHLSTRRARRQFWRPPPAAQILSPAGQAWLRAHGPVGARDRATLALLQRHDVPAWYSGCLTLTLPAAAGPRDDLVVACDLPPAHLAALKQRTSTPVVAVSHHDATTAGHDARMARAESLLALYGRARAVVTSRLHCALPCLALGTPVLFVRIDPDLGRQQPGLDLAHATTSADFLAGRHAFDIDRPPSNPDGWQALAGDLERRCRAFVAAAQATPAGVAA